MTLKAEKHMVRQQPILTRKADHCPRAKPEGLHTGIAFTAGGPTARGIGKRVTGLLRLLLERCRRSSRRDLRCLLRSRDALCEIVRGLYILVEGHHDP